MNKTPEVMIAGYGSSGFDAGDAAKSRSSVRDLKIKI